jgi:hypothetical protein
MKLALEIPIPHLEELSELTEFDYALAHEVLKHGSLSRYTKFYRDQSRKGRAVWIDNGVNELGVPLNIGDILKAAKMVEATHVVAPDFLHKPDLTKRGVISMQWEIHRLKLPYKLIGVWQGFKKDLRELNNLCDVVALPYRKLRDKYMDGDDSSRYHYLGFRTLDELRRFPPQSLDTSLPIRAAIYGINLEERERRPSTPLLDITKELSSHELVKAKENILLVKKVGGEAWESKFGTRS